MGGSPVFLSSISVPLYIANLGLLVFLFIQGKMIKGAVSWFDLGPFNYQPSETMKIATVLVLGWWLSDSMGRLSPCWRVTASRPARPQAQPADHGVLPMCPV